MIIWFEVSIGAPSDEANRLLAHIANNNRELIRLQSRRLNISRTGDVDFFCRTSSANSEMVSA